ncbi:conserved hypothetical protein [Ricinus communis]|uniref:Uncharacterized protein n=1 Tax=Ricinus communis TaxID=3988 RepID=B9T200_RICCO|nr:conserved hypothetical protein [Ricinus communis]
MPQVKVLKCPRKIKNNIVYYVRKKVTIGADAQIKVTKFLRVDPAPIGSRQDRVNTRSSKNIPRGNTAPSSSNQPRVNIALSSSSGT